MTLNAEYVAPITTPGHYTVTDDNTGRTFTVAPDDFPEDPRAWDDAVELMIYNGDRNLATDEPHSQLSQAFTRYYDATGDDERALTLTRRYARAYGDDAMRSVHIETASIHGCSQSDWAEALIVAPTANAGRAALASYRQYFAGNVWVVIDDKTGDALAGIYADDPEDAVREYMASA